MLRTQHGTVTNYYGYACLCLASTPRESRQVEVVLTVVSYRSRDHRRFLSQTSYANISTDILILIIPIARKMCQGQRARQKYDKEEEEKQRGRKLR